VLSLRPEHVKRYKDIARLLLRYGHGDLVRRAGLTELLPDEPRETVGAHAKARALADDIEKLGPTFIKLAQLLSTRPDIIPPAYADSLARLQDDVEPVPFAAVEKILAEELGEELAVAFSWIDATPLAAASIAQVHRATLADGRQVVLKVQRPGVRERVLGDLDALTEVAGFLEKHTTFGERLSAATLFAEFRRSMLRELDFRQEALHLVTLRTNLADIEEIVVPQPVLAYSTSRVLTMEFIDGRKITTLDPLVLARVDGERLADALLRAYLRQILRDGFFHADPHPGNVFLVEGRIALLDLGMVARVRPALQDRLLQLLLAVSENRPDDAVNVLLWLAEDRDDADQAAFRRGVADIIGQHQEISLSRPQVGRAVLMLLKVAAESGVRLPPELAMIGKTLLNLDEIGHRLAPGFDTNAAVRRHAGRITEEQMARDVSPGSLFSAAVELKNFVQHLPGRINRILDRVAENDLKLRVDALDEASLMEGMQKVANRITLGLVLAALIVGAALLMRVDTSFRILGYPGLAILLFLAAAVGGFCLVVAILASDITAGRKKRRRMGA
jgi:predicted unusual protein kinase regulating ubiquinone biosynthesis (AarF/ABC1/UbiB family)